MRILIATHRAYPTLGGLEKHVYSCGMRLSYKNDDLNILNLAFDEHSNTYHQHGTRFAIQTVKALFIRTGAMPLPFISAIKYYKTISKYNPDIVHTHGRYFPSTMITYLYAWLNKKPLIHTEHIEGEIQLENILLQKLTNTIVNIFAKSLYKYATYTTAVSQPAARYLSNKYDSNVKLIANFITPSGLDAYKATKDQYDLSEILDKAKINMYFPYRLVASKGFTKAIKLAEQHDWINLIIAGDGEGVGDVQKAATKFNKLYISIKLL